MKRLAIILVILSLLMLAACEGEPATSGDVSEFENRIASLENQLAERESTISDLETQLDAKSNQISTLEQRLAELEELLEETTTPAPTPSPSTFEPIVITGSGDKTSPPFTVTTEEWIIDWSYVPDPEYPEFAVFGFYVYPRGETLWDVESVLFPKGTSGSTYVYADAGDYYVEVSTANIESWEIIIKPPE